jgi:hypothetical protein
MSIDVIASSDPQHLLEAPEGLPDGSWWVFHEPHLTIRADLEKLCSLMLKDIGGLYHPVFACAYQMGHSLGQDQLLEDWKAEGFPIALGVMECGFIVRRNTEQIRALGKFWKQTPGPSKLTLAYACWKMGIEPGFIEGKPLKNPLYDWSPPEVIEPRIIFG